MEAEKSESEKLRLPPLHLISYFFTAALLHIKGRLFDNIEGGEFFSQNIPNKVKAEKLRRW